MPRRGTKYDDMELYNFIKGYIEKNKYSPSLREMVRGTSYTSTSIVTLGVNRLVNRGYISKTPLIARGIVVIK
jgi:SOS-response transcriptional repressor LexA